MCIFVYDFLFDSGNWTHPGAVAIAIDLNSAKAIAIVIIKTLTSSIFPVFKLNQLQIFCNLKRYWFPNFNQSDSRFT